MPTSRERFLAALRRESTDRPPVWFMRQAGRYLPEYHEARGDTSFMEAVRTPSLAAEITLQPLRRFDLDAAVVYSDILVPPAAMGMEVEVHPGRGPELAPVVRTRADVDRLRDFDPARDCAFLDEALRLVRMQLGEEKALLGFCGAPFTTASYMVEGASTKTFENVMRMLYADPDAFAALLDRVVDGLVPYLAMQVDAGADALQVFDSWGGQLDADRYRRALLPSLTRLVEGARATGAPVIVYCNGGGHLLEVLADSGADCLSIDWRVAPADAIARVGERVALQGNLDPTALVADAGVARRETERVLDAFAGARGHVFNVGSGLIPATNPDAVAAAADAVAARG